MKTIYDYLIDTKDEEPLEQIQLDEALVAQNKNKLLEDPKQKVSALTLTFAERFHSLDPKRLWVMAREHVKRFYDKTRTGYVLNLQSEFTPTNHILHFHGYMCSTPYVVSKFLSSWRRTFGYTKSKPPFNLSAWMNEYIQPQYKPIYSYRRPFAKAKGPTK